MYGNMYGLADLLLCLFAFIIFIIAPIAIVIALVASSSKKSKSPSEQLPVPGSPAETELGHIDYLLQALEVAASEKVISPKAFAALRERFTKRKEHLTQMIRPAPPVSVPAAAPPLAPAEPKPAVYRPAYREEAAPRQIIKPAPEEVKPREPLTLARITRWLLYIGVFLLFIATVIFAVYKWQTFPEIVKFLILILVTLSFYLGGWYLKETLNIEKGGLALVAVGALMTFFDGYIYLNAKDLLDNQLAWAAVFLICSLVYLLVAWLIKHRLFIYFSCTTQALSVYCAGLYYLDLSHTKYLTDLSCLGTFVALELLCGLWWLAEVLSKRNTRLAGLLRQPLFYMANMVMGLTAVAYVFLLVSDYLNDHLATATLALHLTFNLGLIIFYAFNCRFRKGVNYLYPVFPAQFFSLVSCLLYFKVPHEYYILSFALLASIWIIAAWSFKAGQRLIYLERPAAVSAYFLAGSFSPVFVLYLAWSVLNPHPVVNTATVANIITAGGLVVFYALASLYERKELLFYPVLFFKFVCLSLLYDKLDWPGEYYALVLVILSGVWLLAAWAFKSGGLFKFLERPLSYASNVLSVIGAAIFIFSGLSLMIDHGSVRAVATIANLWTAGVFLIFYALDTFYQNEDTFFFPALFFFTVFYSLIFLKAQVPDDFFFPLLVVPAMLWVVAAWGLERARFLELIHEPLVYGAVALAMGIGIFGAGKVLFYLLELVFSNSTTAFPLAADIVGCFALAVLFAFVTLYLEEGLLFYPALLFTTFLSQLVLLRIGIQTNYIAVPAAVTGFVYVAGNYFSRESEAKDTSTPFLHMAYAVSIYALFLSFAYQPALITVLLLNGVLYLALAFIAGNDQVHLWLGLSQMALALFVALDYYDVSHLLANVTYITLYLTVFSVSLAFKEIGLKKAKEWGTEFFNFSVIFCLAQLLLQIYGSAFHGYLPPWIFDPAGGANILMAAFILAGFFFLMATQLYPAETVVYLGYLFFLIAYIIKIVDLDVNFIEWYSVPIGIYVIAMGYLLQKRHPEIKILAISNFAGMMSICGSSTVAFMVATETPAAQLHALFAALLALVFLAVGVVGRTKLFFFGGILFLAWNAIYQSWEFIYALPKWVTIGLLGLVLVASGIYLERRREQFLEWMRSAKEAMIKEWS